MKPTTVTNHSVDGVTQGLGAPDEDRRAVADHLRSPPRQPVRTRGRLSAYWSGR